MSRITTIALVTSAVAALTTHLSLAKTSQYKLIAFNNCEVVAEHELNQAQISAYMLLQDAEKRMESISQPVNAIENDIDQFSDRINDLTNRAIQEDDNSLYIDKKLLREQEQISEELESLIKAHETDFAALEKEARVIEANAKNFEKEITPLINKIEHDFVRIVGPDNKQDPYACDNRNMTMITK